MPVITGQHFAEHLRNHDVRFLSWDPNYDYFDCARNGVAVRCLFVENGQFDSAYLLDHDRPGYRFPVRGSTMRSLAAVQRALGVTP